MSVMGLMRTIKGTVFTRTASRRASDMRFLPSMPRSRKVPRERSLLWLAYAQGWSHEEIARSLNLKTASLKTLLHRARRRLIDLLRNPRGPGGRP